MVVMLRTDARITSNFTSTPHLSTMWWIPGTVGGSTADATDCLDRFRDVWVALAPRMALSHSTQLQGTCVAVESATGVLTGVFAGVAGAAVASTGGSVPLPQQTQGLMRWGTSGVVAGRRVAGRTFVPGPEETDNDASGNPSTTYNTGLALGITALLAAGATASVPCIWSRPIPGRAGSAHAITSGAPGQDWSVLRSRR